MLSNTLTILLLLCCSIAHADAPSVPLAPGYSDLGYPVPEPGSYQLPPVTTAADGEVVNSDGKTLRLHELFGDRYVLLSFMYSSCGDVNGCPLTAHVFYQLKRAMALDPVLAQNLRLVSLSFDPQYDTPEVMKLYANNFRFGGDKGQWRFATTRSEEQLAPILEAYAQDVQRKLATGGGASANFFHVLRVFLIDPQHRVRNIYSVSFLHTDLILADLKTLLLKEGAAQPVAVSSAITGTMLGGPGDRKSGYESAAYITSSLDLQNRKGQAADLISYADKPPLGLPRLAIPEGQVLSRQSIALGRKLFFDRRLSLNNTLSCAMCHVPEQGFSNNELATAVGIEGRTVRRNAPTLYNVGFATRLFHDGREDQLAQQVWGPLLAKNEMGNPSIGHVINKIRALPDYTGLFEAAFGGEGPGMQTIGNALAAYQLTLNAADSPFDRWYFGGDDAAVSQQVKQGFALFRGKAACAGCHLVAEGHALFSDYRMHNTGVGYLSSVVDEQATQTVQLAPGVFVQVDKQLIAKVGEPAMADLGLYEITENPADRWKFRTPSLRNVALSAPYMHDGSIATLREIVQFYNRGGVDNVLLDPLLQPLHLSGEEAEALVAFLQALTGRNVPELVADAFAAPVGDISRDDPHWAHQPDGPQQ
jgi:cytochrome c peroxidase